MDQALLRWIDQTQLSTLVRRSDWAVMGLESVHLLGLALLGGAATLIALVAIQRRGLRNLPLATLAKALMPILVTGLVLMAISGALIAQSMPYKYYSNTVFRIKMLLLLAAIASTAWLRSALYRGSTTEQRTLALLSFAIWLGVGVSGRLIGFL